MTHMHHEAFVHIRPETVRLREHRPDARHIDSGGMDLRWAPAYTSADSLLEVGVQRLNGSMQVGGCDGREIAMIVTGGGAQISWGTQSIELSPGDIFIQDSPIPDHTMEGEQLEAVYVVRFLDSAVRALARPTG